MTLPYALFSVNRKELISIVYCLKRNSVFPTDRLKSVCACTYCTDDTDPCKTYYTITVDTPIFLNMNLRVRNM